MKTETRVWGFVAFLIALSLLMLCAPAWATNRDNNEANAEVGDVTVGGDSSDAYALGNVLGDVDIAGCLGSTQWNTPLFGKQKLVLNWPCMTEFYLRNGMYENAQMAICNTEIREEYQSEDECRAAHPFKAMAIVVPTESDDEDEEHEQIAAELAQVRAELKALQDEKKKAMARVARAEKVAQRAYAAPQTVQYGITEQQRAELAEVFSK